MIDSEVLFQDTRPKSKKTNRLAEAYNAVGYAIMPSLGVIGSWIGNKRARTNSTALWTDGSVLGYKDACIGATSDDKDRLKYIVWPAIVDKGCSRILNTLEIAADIVNSAMDKEVVFKAGAPIKLQDNGQAIVFNRIAKGEIEIGRLSKDVHGNDC
jgi:hypothetical protein